MNAITSVTVSAINIYFIPLLIYWIHLNVEYFSSLQLTLYLKRFASTVPI